MGYDSDGSACRRCIRDTARTQNRAARRTRCDDDSLEAMPRSIHHDMRTAIRRNPRQAESLLNLYVVAKHLARVGDMATNNVIYMVEALSSDTVQKNRRSNAGAAAFRSEPARRRASAPRPLTRQWCWPGILG